MKIYKTLIIGAGISGLTTANALLDRGMNKEDLLILEGKKEIGGLIKTTREQGFICEWGPEGLRGNSTNTHKVFRFSGIKPIASTDHAKTRYIIKNKKVTALPKGPLSAITTPVIGLRSKIRIFGEPWVRAKTEDETVEEFFARRFGKGIVPLVDALVSGIFGGNPSKLSISYAFPALKEAERRSGSVIKGIMRSRKSSRKNKKSSGKQEKKPFLYSPKGGMHSLIRALAQNVNINLGEQVSTISKEKDTFVVSTSSAQYKAKKVVVAIGTQGLQELAINNEQIPITTDVAKVTVVSLGYDEDTLTKPIEGYGFLSPSIEETYILGTLFASKLFTEQAPDGKVLLRCFVGGQRHPERSELEKETLISEVKKELEDLLDISGDPSYVSIQRHSPLGIPQLTMNHKRNLVWRKEIQQRYPGLYFRGIGWNSISCDGLIGEALELAEDIIR